MKKLFKKWLPLFYGAGFNFIALLSRKKAAEMAFKTFSKIRKGRIQPAQSDFLDPARLQQETMGSQQLQAYHWPGNGASVLLVHGWESNSFRWQLLVGELQQAGLSVYAFDAPGHGYSGGSSLHVPLYTECLQYMMVKYQPDFIVAHSVGGLAALFHQYKYPGNRIDKLVTIGSPSEFQEIMAHYRQLLRLSPRVMEALDQLFSEKFGYSFREFSSLHFAREYPGRGLLFHDLSDPITPYRASAELQKVWAGSKLITTEGLGHSMQHRDIYTQIVAFLKS